MRSLHVLLIVLASCFGAGNVFGAEDDAPPYYLTDTELDKKLGVDEKIEAPKEYVWVVYFHKVPGCDNCQLMSKYTFDTVKELFANEVKARKIVLRYQDFENKKNIELVRRLNISSPTLAIIQIRDGKPVKAKRAAEIWSEAADKENFMFYVEMEIRAYADGLK
jgi:hypothetical protein